MNPLCLPRFGQQQPLGLRVFGRVAYLAVHRITTQYTPTYLRPLSWRRRGTNQTQAGMSDARRTPKAISNRQRSGGKHPQLLK